MRFARQPTEQEHEELERMTQQEVGRVALRAQMILLSAREFTAPDIADIQSTSDVSVYKWLDRFDEEGPEGLYDRPRSGQPPKVDKAVEEKIEESLAEPPTEQGYNFTYWTVPLLTAHLQQLLDKSFCEETIRTALHALGFRWRRPRWTVMREDPQGAGLMWAIWEATRDATEGTLVLIQDETTFKSLPTLRTMRMRKGQQARILTPPDNDSISRRSAKLSGSSSKSTGLLIC